MKKKVNPNKIPLLNCKPDFHKISEVASDKATLIAWAEVLGALADFPNMCTEKMQQVWADANKAAVRVHHQKDVEFWTPKIEEIAGIRLPYTLASLSDIHTKGELNRAMRKIERKALVFAYTIIGQQFVEKELLPLGDVGRVFQKADSLDKEIADQRITIDTSCLLFDFLYYMQDKENLNEFWFSKRMWESSRKLWVSTRHSRVGSQPMSGDR